MCEVFQFCFAKYDDVSSACPLNEYLAYGPEIPRYGLVSHPKIKIYTVDHIPHMLSIPVIPF
jgi:hypothetical protein